MRTQSAARKKGASVARAPDTPAVQTLRDQLKRLTRERLISTATELFSRNGYRATSIGEIAKAAGTTPTTFYRYFSGKLDIARLLQDSINVEVKKNLSRLDAIRRPTPQALRGWLDEYEYMWRRMHELCNAFWEASSTDTELAAELVPVTFRLTEPLNLLSSLPEGEERVRIQTRLVMMYLLLDRLLYLVKIQGRNAAALRMLDEFSEIFRTAIFPEK